MKSGARRITILFTLLGLIPLVSGQDCSFSSPLSNFSVDTVCSPVTADWTVSYAGVADAGVTVGIRIAWGDGTADTLSAVEIDAGNDRWEASGNHIYLGADSTCLFRATAYLMVDGVSCPLSELDTVVKVWDMEEAVVPIPDVHEVCQGDVVSVQFFDSTIYNCNPAVELDSANMGSRWVQWVYGTNSSLTGSSVLVGGVAETYPFEGEVKKFSGMMAEAEKMSLPISLAGDHQASEEFEVELRYWNYCNPYEPGPPATPVTQTALIRIVETPDPTITDVDPVCPSDAPFQLEAASPGGIWYGSGVDSVSGIFSPMLAGAGVHEIIYMVKVGASCTPSDTAEIEVVAVPDILLDVDPDGSCSPVNASFTVNDDYQEYLWDFGDGSTSTSLNPDHVFSFSYEEVVQGSGDNMSFLRHDTTFVVWLKASTAEGCMDSAQYHMLVRPSPQADFTVANSELQYPDTLLQVINLTNGGDWMYHWDFGDQVSSEEKDPLPHPYLLWNSYEVVLRAYSDFCSDTASMQVNLNPPSPRSVFTTSLNGCAPFEADFLNNSLYADSFTWDFGDGNSSTQANPVHLFVEPGSYVVKLTSTGPSGTDVMEETITVFEGPELDFTVSDIYAENLLHEFLFENLSEGAEYYLWNFGDGVTSAEVHPAHIYGKSGTFSVSLIGGDQNDCIDTLIMPQFISVVVGEGSVKFPNAFKWAGAGPGDGYWKETPEDNSIFHPTVINVSEFSMIIYSRWGVKLFESNELYIGWDGFLEDGQLASEGVYVYKASVKFVDGSSAIYSGDITFLHDGNQ